MRRRHDPIMIHLDLIRIERYHKIISMHRFSEGGTIYGRHVRYILYGAHGLTSGLCSFLHAMLVSIIL